jgi:hypothetical protein
MKVGYKIFMLDHLSSDIKEQTQHMNVCKRLSKITLVYKRFFFFFTKEFLASS